LHGRERQEQDEQFEDEQPAHPDPDPEDDFELYPTENPKDDIFFLGAPLPQPGHVTGSSVRKTRHSKSSPQFSQLYS
jgi:hypothetical protein